MLVEMVITSGEGWGVEDGGGECGNISGEGWSLLEDGKQIILEEMVLSTYRM